MQQAKEQLYVTHQVRHTHSLHVLPFGHSCVMEAADVNFPPSYVCILPVSP